MSNVVLPPVSIATLEAGTVDPAHFNHEAHVYAAWLYLERWPLHEAIGRFCAALRRLTVSLGAETKYHETVSWFFLLLIQQRRVTTMAKSWSNFRRENSDVISNSAQILSHFYSEELLHSDLGRQHFMLPDRLPLSTD